MATAVWWELFADCSCSLVLVAGTASGSRRSLTRPHSSGSVVEFLRQGLGELASFRPPWRPSDFRIAR